MNEELLGIPRRVLLTAEARKLLRECRQRSNVPAPPSSYVEEALRLLLERYRREPERVEQQKRLEGG